MEENQQVLKNFDEEVLACARVNPSFDEPVLNQALRIAVYDEYRAYETYKKILETFGDIQPFSNIIQAEVNHYQALIPLLEKYQVEIPVNDWEVKVVAPNTVLEACETGVAAELENIKMYDNLIVYVKDYPDVLDLMYRLQAASYNNHLPIFREHVVKYSNNTINTTNISDQTVGKDPMSGINEAMGKMDEFSSIASKIASGEMSQEDIMKLLTNGNVSLLGGAVLGALGAGVVTQMIKDKEEESKKGEN